MGLMGCFLSDFSWNSALTQITPDATWGSERSVVTPLDALGLPVDRIDGGATRGANLFHSFLEFNVDANRGAYFFSPANIQNILVRVTGSPSEILGTLGTFGSSNANLFLINPYGIIFGQNARLDVRGSLVATTANAIQFGNQGFFSATQPEAPPLLTVNPSAFFFNQTGTGAITNQSVVGLRVPEGRSLLLLGGDVRLEGGILQAPGGRIELGGISAPGTVGLIVDGNTFSLSFLDGVARADVSLTNGAEVDAAAGGGGSIAINAQTVEILGESIIFTGIERGLGAVGSRAGDIEINATGAMTVSNSFIANQVIGIGQGGDIEITANSLSVADGAQLIAVTAGRGDAGNVRIHASDTVSFAGVGSNGRSTGAFSQVIRGAEGKGGDIEITTHSLLVTDGAQLAVSTFGQGDSGNLRIRASDTVSLAGAGSNGRPSRAGSGVAPGGEGRGGDVEITANSLSVTDGAQLITGTSGRGDSGNLRIRAAETVSFAGVGSNGVSSGAGSQVASGAEGNGGDVEITTNSLSVTDGADLIASTEGQGDAGNVRITATEKVSFAGVGSNGALSGAASQVLLGGEGNSGDVEITTHSLSVTNGAQLSASTFGRGDAGNVRIIATDTVSFAGVGSNGRSSGASSAVGFGGEGNGGDVEITTNSLSVTDGAQLIASTGGLGDAGNVRIAATEKVSFADVGSNGLSSGAFSQVLLGGEGKGGDVEITTNTLALTDGARLSVSTFGQGNAGTVRITATETISFSGVGSNGTPSGAASQVGLGGEGKGGDVEITTNSLSVTDGAQLSAGTFGRGNAGTVRITATETISFAGVGSNGNPSGAFSSVESGSEGNGGNVEINTHSLSVTDGAQLSALTRERGDAGNVRITATDRVSFSGMASNGAPSGAFSSVERDAEGKGGDVEITTHALSVTDGAQLNASTFGRGDAGNVRIRATDTVSFVGVGSNGNPSAAFSSVERDAEGNGGDVEITTGSLFLADAAIISRSEGIGRAGDIIIQTRENLELNRSQIRATTLSGDGGDVSLQVGDLLLMRDESKISTTAGEAGTGGDGGNIKINADFIVAVPKENSDITANAFEGRGGNINITTQGIYGIKFRPRLTPLSDITASSDFGVDGVVEINTPDIDPSQGLANLPSEPVNTEVAQDCQVIGGKTTSSFISTGSGGLPINPYEPLDSREILAEIQPPAQWTSQSTDAASTSTSPKTTGDSVVEAQGWIINPKGEVVLVAEVPLTPSESGCRLR